MKKLIFTLVIALSALFAMAQNTVPNGGYESWTSGMPDYWTTKVSGNVIATLPIIGDFPYPVSANFGSQVSDPHSGSFALKLMASNVGIPSTEYNIMIPGIAQLGSAGEFSIPMSTITDLMNGGIDSVNADNIEELATFLNLVASGMPCTQTPYSLKFWMKYFPQGNDTMRVIAFTKLNGEPVSYAMFEGGKQENEYVEVTVPFDNPLAACDSICIMFISGGMNTNAYTELYVDDVELDFTEGVVEYNNALKVNVYPNPATDCFFIAPASGDVYKYQLIDLTGRKVAYAEHASGTVSVDTRSLVPGVYMLYIEQKNQTLTKKVVVR